MTTQTGAPTPFWLDLAGRRVVVIGGGPVAARRVHSFLDGGADVLVIAPSLCAELVRLVVAERLRWRARTYRGPRDLDGAWVVHTATGDARVDQAVGRDAEALRVWCVVASQADLGTAAMSARTSTNAPVQVSVYGGRDPRRAIAVRDAIAQLLANGAVDLSPQRPTHSTRHPLRVVA